MTEDYSIETCKNLEQRFYDANLRRPMRISRYDAGTELTYDVSGVAGSGRANVSLHIEKFVGGGFAGQVYKIRITDIHARAGSIGDLKVGGIYAMKILIPPSNFSLLFRNSLYWLGFQGPFQLQVNPAAARAGALWQKFIRKGAEIRFGDDKAVVDIHATFVDKALGSCGELSQWLDGRTWRLEVDDHLDALKLWRKGKPVDDTLLGSPEYRAKHTFMHEFVDLLHDMGGHEFARQYEWATAKSQPNCLKRTDTENDPQKGLTAVDFRAGLALLPFLPMSPGDFKLIFKGLGRGSLVQFDRGSINTLESFMDAHPDAFSDMRNMLTELKACEETYRNSVPDITHNHVRLLYSGKLWSTMLNSAVTGWKVRNIVDDRQAETFYQRKGLTILFFLIGILPILGPFFKKLIGHASWRSHYRGIFTSRDYFKRALYGKCIERILSYHRDGRIDKDKALAMADAPFRLMIHMPISLLPVGLHRMLTDLAYAKERFDNLLIRPVRLYFDEELREDWLRDMVAEGRNKHILNDEDAETILSQIKEPFIQKYLKSLAVHVCTLPVTQVVSVIVAGVYVLMHPELSGKEAWAYGLGILALFQVVPISPGSLVRGSYVLYLVIKERNFKDYNIAVFLGFFKYIGYLAFPIQMAYRYPVLARFMAAHWANESVHIVPVFGESGALLERWVYCLFYNWPLTIRRRIQKRTANRTTLTPRYWHILLCALAAASLFGTAEMVFLHTYDRLPLVKEIWWLVLLIPYISGAVTTIGAKGAPLGKRFIGATICGALTGIFYTGITLWISHDAGISIKSIVVDCFWRVFLFSIFSTIGSIITEMRIPDPDIQKVTP